MRDGDGQKRRWVAGEEEGWKEMSCLGVAVLVV